MAAIRPRSAQRTAHTTPTRGDAVTPLPRRAEPLHNLPLQLTAFVGRRRELARLCDLLRTQRLVTLVGMGGIGKTRLALEVAADVLDAYRDGVWLVQLASLTQAELLPQAIAVGLGIQLEAPLEVLERLHEFLRGRQLLLVLDNCEHLASACASMVEALLRSCPYLTILATSREPLRIGGEVTWRVGPLGLPAPEHTRSARELLEAEAVRLFVDRAAAAADFALSDANAPAVARLSQQLDGIPLAIELAAARVGVLSVEQIVARLDDRFRLLVGGSRTAPARQQTLRATIDWSYDLLEPAEQQLLRQLAVFAGGWTLEAAEAVCAADGSGSDVFELLASLVDKSLVVSEPGTGPERRYRLLDTVRQYAQERLQAERQAEAAVRVRHCAYYCALAEEVEVHILWGAGDVEWLARLDAELANVRAALAWSASPAADPALGLRLVRHLGHFWYTRGHRSEGRACCARALARVAAQGHADAASAAWATLWAGALAHGQSEYDAAVALLQEALQRFEPLDDQRGVGWALSFLGHVARARSELAVAVDYLERAVAAFESIGDSLSLISPLAALGFAVGALGEPRRATLLLERSVALARQTGSRGRLAIACLYLGQVAFAQGASDRAAAAWQEGLHLSKEWGSAWGVAECLEGLAVLAGAGCQPEQAARLLGAAARLRESIGAPVHPVDRPDHERTLAGVQAALGTEAFGAAWAAGQAMSLEAAIELAAASPPAPAAASDAAAGSRPALVRHPAAVSDPAALSQPVAMRQPVAMPLSARELEVAGLIARGASNRQIADALVISERTVANHVEHILTKLDFRSRAQVATWITEHRLTDASLDRPP